MSTPSTTETKVRDVQSAAPVEGEAPVPAAEPVEAPALGMRERLVTFLQNGDIAAFNAARPKGRLDLSKIELAGKDLSGADLSDVILTGAVLDGATFGEGTKLVNAVLRNISAIGAVFAKADLTRAILNDSDLREARFEGAILEHAHAERSQFGRARFIDVRAAHSDFSNAQLQDTVIEGSQFAEAAFMRAVLTGTEIRRADFAKIKGENAELSRCRLEDVLLDLAVLTRTKVDGAQFLHCTLDGADLSRATGAGARFENSFLRDAVLEHVDLPGVSFNTVDMTGVKAFRACFEGAKFTKVCAEKGEFNVASFDNAEITESWFKDSKFVQAQLNKCRATGTSWNGCKFELAWLEGAELAKCSLRDAKFIMSFFNNAHFDGSDLCGAAFSQAQGAQSTFKGAYISGTNFNLAMLPGASFDGAFQGAKGASFVKVQIDPEALSKIRSEDAPAGTFPEIVKPAGPAPFSKLDGAAPAETHIALASLLPSDRRAEYEKALNDLNELVGLDEVKEIVTGLAASVKLNLARQAMGLPVLDRSLHAVFMGNPGTGKTTVARLLGKLYWSLGYLEKGHVVEVDRGGLVGGYVGQTEEKTAKKCQEALGGVLFIDEAYDLAEGGENDFGPRAIATILKFMEDNRGKMVVVVAGYSERIREFIESNPGLASRFKEYVNFRDYSSSELAEIFHRMAEKNVLETEGKANAAPLVLTHLLKLRADENFANARTVRNAFEDTGKRMSARLERQGTVSRADLVSLKLEDLPFKEHTGIPLDAIPWEKLRWNVKDPEGNIVREVGCEEIRKTVIDPITKRDIEVGYPEPTTETARIFAELAAKYPYVPPQNGKAGK